MAEITIKEVPDKKTWEDFLSIHPEANFLQSWQWGEFHKNLGNRIKRVGFYEKSELVGIMLSLVEDAKRGRFLTVPGGPIINWGNSKIIKTFVQEIKMQAKESNCVFVRVRPQLESDDFSKNLFKKNGFINAPMHLHAELTSQLDISKPEEELFSAMRKTTRYEIKKATTLGIEVTATKDPKALKKFYEMQIATSKRQKFVPFSFKFLEKQFEAFVKADHALLYKATIKNIVLAEAFVIFYGQEAVYHYGASTQAGRKYPGAYLIQWEAIKEARKRGIKRYNFWGVAPPLEQNHRFYGISLFKRGFGGQDFQYLHAQDLIISYFRYFVNYLVEYLRKTLRRL